MGFLVSCEQLEPPAGEKQSLLLFLIGEVPLRSYLDVFSKRLQCSFDYDLAAFSQNLSLSKTGVVKLQPRGHKVKLFKLE